MKGVLIKRVKPIGSRWSLGVWEKVALEAFNKRDFNYVWRFCETKFLSDNTTKLKVCYVPATSSASSKAFLLQLFTVLVSQTRQVVCAIKQSISLDVYDCMPMFLTLKKLKKLYSCNRNVIITVHTVIIWFHTVIIAVHTVIQFIL